MIGHLITSEDILNMAMVSVYTAQLDRFART